MSRPSLLILWLAICMFAMLSPAIASQRNIVDSSDQLPKHDYPLACSLDELLSSPDLFAAFAASVRTDLLADLAAYDISDRTTLSRWHASLTTVDMLAGRYDSALDHLAVIRGIQDKPAMKHTSGLLDRAIIAGLKASRGDTGRPVFIETFRREFESALARLPRDVVQNELEQRKGILEMFNREMLLGIVGAQYGPAVTEHGAVGLDLALLIINVQNFLSFTLPVKNEAVAVLDKWINAGSTDEEDVWAGRTVELSPAENAKPVVVAIWDTGVDPDLFTDVLFMNEGELINGRDTDGNGFVDDIHGIAYTWNWQKNRELLYPLGETEDRTHELANMIKGFFDLQAAINSQEASEVLEKMGSLAEEQVGPFMEDLARCAIYVHGTHVAGLASTGNPFIRLLVARLEPDYRMVPAMPTAEMAGRAASAYQEIVNYFKQNQVRIVNMSWGIELQEITRQLEKAGFGSGEDERAGQARRLFNILRNGLLQALRSAPDILFVAAAGNTDADVAFHEYCPSSFDLANLVAVGAVDRAGRETGFTCYGDRIRIYANGFEVESVIPGGRRLKFSGTSMAAPQVVNLAAKLLALDPDLTPREVIELIESGATQDASPKNLLLIHPAQSVQALRQRLSNK